MAGINLFGRWPLVHDAGHLVSACALSLYLWQVGHWPFALAFAIGATALALFVEFTDIYAGGLLVTHEQRIDALIRRVESGHPWRPSRDNIKDFLNYQLAWPIGMAFVAPIEDTIAVGVALLVLNAGFYLKLW